MKYEARLIEGLNSQFKDQITVTTYPNESRRSNGSKLTQYFERYVRYPKEISQISNGLNHICDHTYAYLSRHLNKDMTIVTCHDLIPLVLADIDADAKSSIHKLIFRYKVRSLSNGMHIVAVSQSTKRDIITLLGCDPELIHVIYEGVDEIFFRTVSADELGRTRNKFGLPSSIPILLHVGSCLHYKNIEGILSALNHIKNERKIPFLFVKIGEDFTDRQKRIIMQCRLSPYIKYVGMVSDYDLSCLYRLATVLLFPSLYEGFGFPVLEAMASGCAVVTSREGSLLEISEGSAVHVRPHDTEEIAEAVCKIIDDDDLRSNLIRIGITNARRFTWANCARSTFELYRKVQRSN